MASVIIEGSDRPCSHYPRGVRAEVQRTPHIDRLIDQGFVNVIDDEGHAEPAPLPEPIKPPAKSASRDDWATWLSENTDIVVTDQHTRAALIAAYTEWTVTHDAPAAED